MNILPHKSWHVRTKKNIARVRKDEAKAAEEEKEKQRRIALAVQEDRTRFLRERAVQRLGAPVPGGGSQLEEDNGEAGAAGPAADQPALTLTDLDLTQQNGHINFFQEIEEGTKLDGAANKEHEEEKKKEQEEYEKKIGYLVYLGQNSLEHSKDKMWYEKIDRGKPRASTSTATPDTSAQKDQELADMKLAKLKDFQDPLKDIRKYLSTPGLKSEKDAKKTSSQVTVAKRKISVPEIEPPVSVAKKKPRKDKKKHKEKKHKSKSKKHSKHKKKKSKMQDNSDSRSSGSENSESEDEVDEQELKKKQKLEQLRAERLERERIERRKAQALLEAIKNPGGSGAAAGAAGKSASASEKDADVNGGGGRGRHPQLFPIAKQKYNSQFNPHLARQNFDN